MEVYDNIKMGEKGAWVSITAYICLSVFKLIVGYFANSKALMADGLNNTTDIIASIAVLIGMKISRKPPDENHRYGHFRAETIAALIASLIMVSVGIQVLYEAAISLFENNNETPNMFAGWAAIFSAIIMYIVYKYNLALAQKINSQSLNAAAQDNRSDALVSIGAFVGILGSQWGLSWLDSLAALIVGVIICKTAWEIFRDASHSLTDGFDEKELEKVKKTVAGTPGVVIVKDVKARTHGNIVLVDIIISVNDELNVIESHNITVQIEKRLAKKHKIKNVHIHIEPAQHMF